MPETNVPGGHRAIPVADLTPGRGQRATWIVAVTVSLSIAVFVVFGVGSSTANFGEDSPLAHKYTEVLPGPPGTAPQAIFKDAWGTDSGIRTLVLYDTEGSASAMADAETHAIVTANLATHFGHVQTAPMKDYASGDMAGYDGVVYMGSTSAGSLSMAFQKDMLKDRTPVLWAGGNIAVAAVADRRVNAEFIETYGWDPATSKDSGEEHIDGVTYQGHSLTRNGSAAGPVLVPRITDKGMVDILARTTGSRTHPWAIRSANLTYIGENPLTYVDETDRYLAFADLFYDLLAPDTAPVRQAALRLEDVDAAASPEDLYAITDFLHERGVPFQVAVIPIRLSRTPGGDPDSWVGLSLGDRPDVVKALRYMQQHGGDAHPARDHTSVRNARQPVQRQFRSRF
ncbi:DUF2334 domain-containing protein [Tessaracoccus antarcticus]|nr:DUF2334 domain-containing protein [Tessaracoccus antarcticus]